MTPNDRNITTEITAAAAWRWHMIELGDWVVG